MRQNSRLIYGIFISIGITLLLLASILRSQNLSLPSDITLNVGMVVLSLALIDFLWKIVGGDPLSQEISQLKKMNILNQDAASTGLMRVLAKADNAEREMLTNLYKNSRQLIDISGWTLKGSLP